MWHKSHLVAAPGVTPAFQIANDAVTCGTAGRHELDLHILYSIQAHGGGNERKPSSRFSSTSQNRNALEETSACVACSDWGSLLPVQPQPAQQSPNRLLRVVRGKLYGAPDICTTPHLLLGVGLFL